MRIAVFVDGANFFYLQKNCLRWWIDSKKLLDFITEEYGDIVDATYYVGVDSTKNQDDYLKFLMNIGFSIERKDLKTIIQEDGTEKKKANLDIEIVLDMFNTIENYDMAILVSGDGDFERPLKLLKARGRKFLVMSSQGFVAKEIREVAGMHYKDFQVLREKLEKDQRWPIEQREQQPQSIPPIIPAAAPVSQRWA
jgi:uncharacterized LabA/DUF88 family protein